MLKDLSNTSQRKNSANSKEAVVEENINLFRPLSLKEYIGQPQIKDQLRIMISSALTRGECLDHLLFFGNPGMGKTTISQIIANELKANLIITSGQALEKTGDVASILASLKKGDILFIDEIHRLRPKVEEMLYTAMEDFVIDIVLGKGATAKIMRLDIAKFTLIGATTKPNKLASPLKDRFGLALQLLDYDVKELIEILRSNASKLQIEVDEASLERVALCSRGTPRIAIHYLKRARDYLVHNELKLLTYDLTTQFLEGLGLDEDGLNERDRTLLLKIYFDFECGPVGLSTLSASINDDPENIEFMIEPFLIRLGYLKRTHRGRQLTNKGVEFAKRLVV